MNVAERNSSAARIEVPVLMYHEVAKPEEMQALGRITQSNYVLTIDEFEAQMNILRDEGCTPINLDQLLSWQSGGSLPPNPVVITFDDGFVGNERHALHILNKHRFVATFFVVTERVGTDWMMSWDQLRKLFAAGMSVESHTANHPLFSSIDKSQTRKELLDSKRSIEAHLGNKVRHVSLPYGDSNPHVAQTARDLGYLTACTSQLGFNGAKTGAFELRRFAMTNTMTPETFRAIARRDTGKLAGMLRNAAIKRRLSKFLGKKNYDRLVNLWYGVKGPQVAAP
ncbi:MAG TPA: polysaccharide deacetylase family protein [Steroidobacteraceae bacterium]|nr:polysaccharide deacetylase family protein [Steroidobacteraceae bacterium]